MQAKSSISAAGLILVASLSIGHAALAGGPGKMQLNLPQATDTNPDPNIFETNLVAHGAQVDLDGDGLMANVFTFNGTLPGPEFRVKVGDRVIVHYTNNLPLPTSVHWHGVEVNNESDGTGVTQNELLTGESFTYDFIVPRSGIFWYHTHIKPTNLEFKGMYGSFIVTDENDQVLSSQKIIPNKGQAHTLMLSDITVCKEPGNNDAETFPMAGQPWAGGDVYPGHSSSPTPETLCESPIDNEGAALGGPLSAGDVPNVQPSPDCDKPNGGCRVNEGQLVLANGRVPASRGGSPEFPGALASGAETLNVKAGEGVRLKMINSAVARYFRLRLTDQDGVQIPLQRIGGEGGLLDTVRLEGGIQQQLDTEYDLGEILLAPADRADVVAVIPKGGQPGDVITLWTLDYSRTGQGFADIPTVPVLHLQIRGGANRKAPYTLDETVNLLTDPSVDDPVEDIKDLPTDTLVDPSTLTDTPPGTDNPEIEFTNNIIGPAINLVRGTFDAGSVADFASIPHLDSSRYARVGDLLELSISNTTSGHHPFHMHGFSIQPVRMLENDGGTTVRTYKYNEFIDTVDIPSRHTLVFRVRLDDRVMKDGVTPEGAVGRWVFHCHIFHHAAQGMISELVVLPKLLD